ncbi:MAG: hypothetical protein KJN98_02125 [Pontiella sp.]|nr:hypothetical protein [Pontiella sp.]
MPKLQQNTYLSHAKSPQQYGFQLFRTPDGVAFNGSTRLHPNHRAAIRLTNGNIPVVDVRGRSPRMKAKALLDTSSPSSWMEFSTSQDFGAVFMAHEEQPIPYRGGYNLGNADAYAGMVTQLRFDQLIMENTPLYVRMALHSLGPLARGIRKPNVDAVIGYDVLSQFEYVQFDFDAGLVRFSASSPYVPHQDLLMTQARISPQANFGLAVEGAIFGKSTPIVLDFAGDYHFARGDVKVSSTKQVSIGDLVYRKVPTLLLPTHSSPPRAGRKMLEKYIVTLAPRQGVVYFERFPE